LEGVSRITLAVSSAEPGSTVARAVTQEVRALHAQTLISDVIDVNQQIDATLVSESLLSTLASGFAALAVGLAAIGLYGVLSYSVARRRSEFGVRLALGARPWRIRSVVLREVVIQVGAGIAIGLPLALTIARMVSSMLFGVAPADPANYVVSVALLTGVGWVAAWIPARRAARIDPAVALRAE
jgi:ABC-type antimicrobial peptide transport system permease subunit